MQFDWVNKYVPGWTWDSLTIREKVKARGKRPVRNTERRRKGARGLIPGHPVEPIVGDALAALHMWRTLDKRDLDRACGHDIDNTRSSHRTRLWNMGVMESGISSIRGMGIPSLIHMTDIGGTRDLLMSIGLRDDDVDSILGTASVDLRTGGFLHDVICSSIGLDYGPLVHLALGEGACARPGSDKASADLALWRRGCPLVMVEVTRSRSHLTDKMMAWAEVMEERKDISVVFLDANPLRSSGKEDSIRESIRSTIRKVIKAHHGVHDRLAVAWVGDWYPSGFEEIPDWHLPVNIWNGIAWSKSHWLDSQMWGDENRATPATLAGTGAAVRALMPEHRHVMADAIRRDEEGVGWSGPLVSWDEGDDLEDIEWD